MKHLLAAALLAFGLHGLAHAGADASRHLITAATLAKLKAAEADLKKAGRLEDDDDDLEDKTVEELARAIDAKPAIKAALARHGLTGMEYALTAHAMLHAGMYLMFEPSMPKDKAASTLAGYTPQQKANIELLRKSGGVVKR